jgi:hypothetical protein
MKQQIEISVEDASELIQFFKLSHKDALAENFFEKTTTSNEFVEFFKTRLESPVDRNQKAKKGVEKILSIANGYHINQITPEKTLKIDLKISPNIFDSDRYEYSKQM